MKVLCNCMLFSLFLCSCKNDNVYFYLKNVSSFKSVCLNIKTDSTVVMNDTLRYDNSEYGHVIISQKLAYGSRQISISIPELGINEIRNIEVKNSNKYCFITLGDNTSKPDYKNGDVKLSVSLVDKLPF